MVRTEIALHGRQTEMEINLSCQSDVFPAAKLRYFRRVEEAGQLHFCHPATMSFHHSGKAGRQSLMDALSEIKLHTICTRCNDGMVRVGISTEWGRYFKRVLISNSFNGVLRCICSCYCFIMIEFKQFPRQRNGRVAFNELHRRNIIWTTAVFAWIRKSTPELSNHRCKS